MIKLGDTIYHPFISSNKVIVDLLSSSLKTSVSLSNNKLEDHSLLPCMHEDYIDATNGIIPERWFKAQKKNII